ncbi:MAG: hypothetical protein AB8B69_14600 [Chitinophagales bacterium]
MQHLWQGLTTTTDSSASNTIPVDNSTTTFTFHLEFNSANET